LSRIRDERGAEDLVQETLLAAFKSRDKFQGNSSELTWMIGILRNKIFEYLRKQAREVPLTASEDDDREESLFDNSHHWKPEHAPQDWAQGPQEQVQSAEFFDSLRQCLDALTPNVSRAFVLREMEGVGHHESAQALGIPAGRLAVLLYRARLRLRRCLERHYFAGETAL
jgi:RNA polymerase sigma-70 factor (ECF subfamily)